jgi:hypothetical protein
MSNELRRKYAEARVAALNPRFFRLLLLAALSLLGCTPSIGDKCVLSTDCSLRGDRLCDTSQPGGYCTIFNCGGNSCPDNAACVLFHAAVQGCGYTDRRTSRTGRTFCMASCGSNSDCRAGYVCADPRNSPWNAVILDDNQAELVCIVPPDDGVISPPSTSESDAAVCQETPPSIDASIVLSDAATGAVDAGVEAGLEAGADAAGDAPSEGAADAPTDALDAGAADAPDSGG